MVRWGALCRISGNAPMDALNYIHIHIRILPLLHLNSRAPMSKKQYGNH